MPKIKRPPPKGILNHLIKRCLERGQERGQVSEADFLELKHWLESDPEVPNGKWYKRFKNGILAGNGEMPSTFLSPGMAVEGEEVE